MSFVSSVSRRAARHVSFLVLFTLVFLSGQAFAVPYPSGPKVQFAPTISLAAGNGTSGDNGDNGPAISAEFQTPVKLAVDAAGNVYVADLYSSRIRKIDTAGKITTVAGNGTAGFSGDNGSATEAEINNPQGVAVDVAGNLYFSDTGNERIRKVDTTGKITTIAGNGTAGFSGDNGPALAAKLNNPAGLAVDASGNLYIADYYNNRIRKVDTSGTITTIAGTGTGVYNGDGILATAANIFYPISVALDTTGHLYIGDFLNHRLRKIYLSTGYIQTVAGTGTEAYNGAAGDGGDASSANIGYAADITTDGSGNIYYADSELQRVRKIGIDGIISTVAGNGTQAYSGDGGPAIQASLNGPTGIAIDSRGTIYIADQTNHVVRAISGNLTVANFATTPTGQGVTTSVAVQLNQSMILRSAGLGSNYSSATYNDFAIGGMSGCLMDGTSVNPAGSVCLLNVTFTPSYPGHRTAPIAITDNFGNQYTLSLAGDATGSAIAYSPSTIYPSALTPSGLSHPAGLAFDNSNNLYIADQNNHQIVVMRNISNPQPVALGNFVTTQPTGVATDAQGNLYIVDFYNQYVIKVTPSGSTSNAGVSSEIDVNANGDALSSASGIAATDRGDLYIADKGHSRIVEVTAERVSSVLDTGALTLNSPEGVAVDSKGNIFIADTFNDRVVKVAFDGNASVVSTGSFTLSRPKAIAVDSIGNLFVADSGNNRVIQVTKDGTGSVIQNSAVSSNNLEGIAIAKVGLLATSDADTNQLGLFLLIQAPTLQFSDTPVGHTSSDGAKIVALQNLGNAPLNFTTPSTGNNPSYPDGFPADDTASPPCAAGATLNPGGSCNVSVNFHPTVAGLNSGSILVSTDMPIGAIPVQPILVRGNALPGMDHFSVTGAPVNSEAGTPFNVTITAADSSNQPFASYSGVVHFTTTDAIAGLPADYAFVPGENGVHTFSVTLKTAGSQTIKVVDMAANALGRVTVQVTADAPTSFTIAGGQGQSATIGSLFSQRLQILLEDQYNNPVPNVSVTYTSPSSGAGLSTSSNTLMSDYSGGASFYAVANGIAGSFQIVAKAEGVSSSLTFNLTNTPGTTTTALAATPSADATYGQSISLTATVTPNGLVSPTISSSPVHPMTIPVPALGPATGTINFYDNTRLVGTASLGGDVVVVGNDRGVASPRGALPPSSGIKASATITINAPIAGDHAYTAVYVGDANFSGSQTTAPLVLTVGQTAATLTGPATQPVSVGAGQTGTITVTVAAQNAATGLANPTGTISYQIGSGSPQLAQVNNGQATLQVPSSLAIGSYSVQATYSGDTNYRPSTAPATIQLSVISTVPADFSLTVNPGMLTIKAGDTGQANFTFTPVGGFTGTVTFGCSNLSAGVSCTFAPANLTADGSNTVQTSQLTVTTQRLVSANLLIPGALLGGLLFWQRRRFSLRMAHVLMLILGATVTAGMVGCGSAPHSNASISSVTVTAQATGGSGGTLSHASTFTLNVTN